MNKKVADFADLEPIDKLDDEELSLHQMLRDGKMIIQQENTKEKYAKIFKASNHKRRALSLRMPENDYINIKAFRYSISIID